MYQYRNERLKYEKGNLENCDPSFKATFHLKLSVSEKAANRM